MGKIKTKNHLSEPKIQDGIDTLSVITTPKGYVVTGAFRFAYGETEETFSQIANRLDDVAVVTRNEILKKIARELGVDVNFTE